jgi:Protein of unknown function (DUF2637)
VLSALQIVEGANVPTLPRADTNRTGSPDASPATAAVRSATRFFWGWLLIATTMSVTGNVAHAVLNASSSTVWVAAGAALVPPAVLLASTHSVALLVRTRTSGLTYWTALLMTAALSVGAFVLSFAALRSLAVTLGWPPAIAWLLPCVIDVAIAQATICLLSLNPPLPQQIRRRRRTSPQGKDPVPAAAEITAAASAPLLNSDGGGETAEIRPWLPVAVRLVDDGITTKPPAIAAAVLAQRAAGAAPGAIGRQFGIHHTTVRRILAAAARYDG